MIAAGTSLLVLGALVDVAAVVVLGAVVVVMLALGGLEDPHAASRIDASAIAPSVTPIRELSKPSCLAVAPVDLMVMIIAARSLLARESVRKSVEASSGRFRCQGRFSPDIARDARWRDETALEFRQTARTSYSWAHSGSSELGDLWLSVGPVTACFATVGFRP
jgi:hypothetical protein